MSVINSGESLTENMTKKKKKKDVNCGLQGVVELECYKLFEQKFDPLLTYTFLHLVGITGTT